MSALPLAPSELALLRGVFMASTAFSNTAQS